MAHFVKLDENNIVIQAIVLDDNLTFNSETNEEDESVGVAWCTSTYGGTWMQTSYNNNIRTRFAGIGYTWNADLDAFVPPKPFASWTLNTTTKDWESPLGEEPTLTAEEVAAGKGYMWDESAYQADNTAGWTLVSP